MSTFTNFVLPQRAHFCGVAWPCEIVPQLSHRKCRRSSAPRWTVGIAISSDRISPSSRATSNGSISLPVWSASMRRLISASSCSMPVVSAMSVLHPAVGAQVILPPAVYPPSEVPENASDW
jgi:hypothetical protein